jgi:hypothetical protein
VHHIRHSPHLAPEVLLPLDIVEIVARRQLGPDAVHQPQRARRMRAVPAAECPIEGRWEDRVDADRIGAHAGDSVEPAGVERAVRRKLGGKPARQRDPEVHALYVEWPPPLAPSDLEPVTPGPGDELQVGGPTARHDGWAAAFRRHPVEPGAEVGVQRVE